MAHPALHEVAHRPWPLEHHSWSLTMDWEDLLFLHWPVDAAVLQECLPPGVEVETFGGTAWLGVVPFRMARTRWRCLPPVPTAHRFPELNVRTYVRAGARAGVWFFSLDAASRLAVAGGRAAFGLPYFHAAMRCERRAQTVDYASERRDRRGAPVRFAARWSASGRVATAAPGSLEHFLVERYCLFALRRGLLVCGDIAHPPWRFASADVQITHNDMASPLGCRLQGPPVSALATDPVRVAAFWPRPWPATK
jgi:uncharacterized protein YqjF (DUF2071 family)